MVINLCYDLSLYYSEVDIAITKANEYVNYVESKHSIHNTGKNTLPHVENMHEAQPEHVLSIKCLSDHTRNSSMNSPAISKIPTAMEDLYNMPQSSDLEEKNIIPDPLKMNKDLLLEDIAKLKITASQDGTTSSILKALTKIEEDLRNEAPNEIYSPRNEESKSGE